jgi:hypothetical protein
MDNAKAIGQEDGVRKMPAARFYLLDPIFLTNAAWVERGSHPAG